MQTNFLLGTLQMTPEARMLLKRVPYDLVCRHAINEHGDITPRQKKINARSMLTIGPIKSRYKADPTNPRTKYIVIYTDETWSSTLITLE
jgi:hypothetical protein